MEKLAPESLGNLKNQIQMALAELDVLWLKSGFGLRAQAVGSFPAIAKNNMGLLAPFSSSFKEFCVVSHGDPFTVLSTKLRMIEDLKAYLEHFQEPGSQKTTYTN